ncbi:MAG: SpoIIIAH-like family protein [Bacilli bacterium]|nr:SpoIIIAH-like family protein [Bacilli bacterium]MBQ8902474.1 SpoIIIAH-like family protein [Bacilli bacterium]
MINKQNLWFVTLFSLILILGIYYVSIDDEVAAVLKTEDTSTNEVIEITESDVLVALEVENDEEKQALMEEYQEILLNSESTLEEKNVAYENMQKLNNNTTNENKIKQLIKEKFSLNAFVKIKDNTISIVVSASEHNTEKANSIIRSVQELYDKEMYITVKFNK